MTFIFWSAALIIGSTRSVFVAVTSFVVVFMFVAIFLLVLCRE